MEVNQNNGLNTSLSKDWKKRLKHLHLQNLERKHPGAFAASGGYSMKSRNYTDKTANGLTKSIIDFINFSGGDAQRINTTGTMRKVNGQMKWTYGGGRKGAADIHAIIQGRAVSIEVKTGRDVMSEHQRKERERITRAGGLYFVAKNMPEFLLWYESKFD